MENKNLLFNISIPIVDLSCQKEHQVITDKEQGQYLGHPDLVELKNGTLFTVYPKGHGQGAIILKKSTDGGKTWSERLKTPKTWEEGKETPTLYIINKADGTQRLQLISGLAFDRKASGFRTAYSEDEGETWTELKHFFDNQNINTIVAHSSLTQMKTKDGNWDNRWMGIFHDFEFNNWKTFLTFDENGEEQWSKLQRLLPEHDAIEKKAQLCEIEVIRSPDGKKLALLARAEKKVTNSMIAFSDDEGEHWSEPKELPRVLMGERHKAAYDPISGRLLITFRDIIRSPNDDSDWHAGDFCAWVGTFDDLFYNREGQYRVILLRDYTASKRGGDCGYAGNICTKDGEFVVISYGHWDKENPQECYIMTVHFNLSELDNIAK